MPDLSPLKIEPASPREKRKRWVRSLLSAKGITVRGLAAHLGISEGHLNGGLYDDQPCLAEKHRRSIVVLLGVDIYASYEPQKGNHGPRS